MQLVTTTGYYSTGSSVISDLLAEYRSVKCLGDNFECRIAHDMFGLSDLEYYLVDNNHRHNSSVAINEFKRLMKLYGLDKRIRFENYPEVFGDVFKTAVDDYLNALAQFTFKGGSHADLYQKSDYELMILKSKNFFYRQFNKVHITADDTSWAKRKRNPFEKSISNETYYISCPTEKQFLDATRCFTRKLFSHFNDSNYAKLMVEQLVPPSNISRYERYFDDIRVFRVDRDPRDLYYLEKYYWRGGVIPEDVELFVKWFEATRAHKKYEKPSPNVLELKFEDLVLDYDNSVKQYLKSLDELAKW